jgi:hypothetical protein
MLVMLVPFPTLELALCRSHSYLDFSFCFSTSVSRILPRRLSLGA